MPSYFTSTAARETAATDADERLETAALEDILAAEDTDEVVDEDEDEDEKEDEDIIVELAEEDCDDVEAFKLVDVADEWLRSDDVVVLSDDADDEPSDGKSTPGVQAATRRTENARSARRMMTGG